MRWPVAPLVSLRDRGGHTAAVFWKTLRAPVHRPRITTRLLMIVVALFALAMWAVLELPQTIDQAVFRRLKAREQAERVREFQDNERERLALAKAVEAERDDWRRRTGFPDELTERYFAERRDLYLVDAQYQREMAAYHAKLASKYGWAKWFPMASLSPDPAPPPDPLTPPPRPFEAGKVYEAVGGISVAFSPTSSGLAVGCWDQTIQFLELPSRRVLASVNLPDFDAHSMVFARDGSALYSLGTSHLVWRWDTVPNSTGRGIPWIDRVQDKPGRLQYPTAVACSPDGQLIAVAAGGYVGTPSMGRPSASSSIYGIRLLSAQTGKLYWECKGAGTASNSVAFAPDGKSLAFATGTSVMVLDTGTGRLKSMPTVATGSVLSVAFSPDGKVLAGAGFDVVGFGGLLGKGRVILWDVAAAEILKTLDGPTGHAQTVAFSPDGRTIAVGGEGPKKNGWDKFAGRRSSMTASEVQLWDVATGKMVWTAFGQSSSASSLAFSADGKVLAFCDGYYVYVIDTGSGRLEQIVMETIWQHHARESPPAADRGSARERAGAKTDLPVMAGAPR